MPARPSHLFTSMSLTALAAAAAACAPPEPVRRYAVSVSDVVVDETATEVSLRGTVHVRGEDDRATSVRFVGGYLVAKGPAEWRTETFTVDGQDVVLEHNDDLKRARVTVDDNEPLELSERLDGRFEYDHRSYQQSRLRDLAAAVARDLERVRTSDEAVVATFEAGRLISEHAQTSARSKLFFLVSFVDVYTEVEAAMNIGADNTITQE